jgi:hypothetical protein
MDLLTEIKKRLSITGDFHDELLLGYAEDVKQYLLSSGVKPRVVDSSKSVGCISRGVFDIWTKDGYSQLFKERVIQLTLIKEESIAEDDIIPNKKAPETPSDDEVLELEEIDEELDNVLQP